MNSSYYQTIDAMEKAGVAKGYIDGWASGFLHNPPRGPQHVTAGYEEGYKDGLEGVADGWQGWMRQAA